MDPSGGERAGGVSGASGADGAWRWAVGTGAAKVVALELVERGNGLYLRWREAGNWRKESLRECARTASGRLITAACDRAKAAARRKHRELMAALAAPLPAPDPLPVELTVADTLAVACDPRRGRWSLATAHGREVARSLALASAHWGQGQAWGSLTRADWRSLWRWRLEALRASGHGGFRGAELVVQRVATVADWLVEDYERLAGAPPEARRARHTLEELRRILEEAEGGDPRFALLLALGAELRLGQVVRCRRADLDLEAGTLRVRGRGRKGGVVVALTPGQQEAAARALGGYLAALERAGGDYPLFPAGQLRGGRSGAGRVLERHRAAGPVGRRWMLAQFRLAEARAGVAHVRGRAAYGVRRAAVDAVKALGISREGLAAHGGWTDTQVPDRIYAEQGAAYAREEAARLRAVLRGESAA